MNSYKYLANVYDEMMSDVDYNGWSAYINSILSKKGAKKLLEVSCGTGGVTFALQEFGYDITASDSSVEMLSAAKRKSADSCSGLRFVQLDMRNLETGIKYDAVISVCDGPNYLDIDGLQMFLNGSYNALKPGGTLLFDISSRYKLENILDAECYFDEADDAVCIWKNTFNESEKLLKMDVTIFIKQKELYKRFFEEHIQYAHSIEDVIEAAKSAGFADTEVLECFSFDPPKGDTQRIQFVCSKI